jgi:hypothetical protein
MDFTGFPKIPRWSREVIITEKIDGTNASIYIGEDGAFLTGSRKRWITPQDDNYGFSNWAHEHKDELMQLGAGHHFGEWWGRGIQRAYDLEVKRFSLFNVKRWNEDNIPKCCDVVPTLYKGVLQDLTVYQRILSLECEGSAAAPGFMRPEGIIIYHVAANQYFKKTLLNDESPKGKTQ